MWIGYVGVIVWKFVYSMYIDNIFIGKGNWRI